MGTNTVGSAKYVRRRRGLNKAVKSQRLRRNKEREERALKEQSCSAFGCNEKFKIGSNIVFFKFPTAKYRRDMWIKAVELENWSPSTSFVCSKHFQTGKPSIRPAHPDYVPNVFSTDSAAKHQSNSNAVQTEESQCVINDSNEIEDVHFDPQSSYSFADISSGGLLSRVPRHPAVVPNLSAFANSVEKHRGHSSTARTQESQCVIYDKIEIEDIPIDPEISTSSINIIERPKEDEISCLKFKLKQAESSVHRLMRAADIWKRERNYTAQLKIACLQKSAEKERELSKLKKELQEAHEEINSLRAEKFVWQNCNTRITDVIFQDAFKLNFYTGLNSAKDFHYLAKLLYDAHATPIRSVSIYSQLLIALMRLQLNFQYLDLADRFQTSVDDVKRICENVIPRLELKLKDSLLSPFPYYHRFSPITADGKPNVSHCNTNAVFVKLYWTIQNYIKSATKE